MKKLQRMLIEERLKNAPQAMKNLQLKNCERMDIESEDEFLTFLNEIEVEPKAEKPNGRRVNPSFTAPDADKIKSLVQDMMKG